METSVDGAARMEPVGRGVLRTRRGETRATAGVQARFGRLAPQLAPNGGGPLSPDRVVQLVGAALGSGGHCALTLVREGRCPRTMAATDDVAAHLERMQRVVGDGPSMDSEAIPSPPVIVEDLTDGGRWPSFATRCVSETPVRSLLTLPLELGGSDCAVLTCYAAHASAFGPADVEAAIMLAPFARAAVQSTLDRGDADELRTALDSSRQVGTAIGILMARRLVTSEQALRLLEDSATYAGDSVANMAARVAAEGDLPPLGGAPVAHEGPAAEA